jgi:hypothetical protein
MRDKNTIKIHSRFEKMGAIAPGKVVANEIWLDVGNRVSSQVLDHHGGDTKAWSASQLILEHYRDFILTPLKNKKEIQLVLHTLPDLDAICAAWLVEMLFKYDQNFIKSKTIEKIVREVSENDQGVTRTDNPEENWVLTVRTIIEEEFKNEDDREILRKGLLLFDKTYEILSGGGDMPDAASAIITYFVRSVFAHARRDYLEDLERAIIFQVMLPVRTSAQAIEYKNKPSTVPDFFKERWSLTDAIFVNNPSSTLFKELAWADKEKCFMKQGFSLIIISRNVQLGKHQAAQRHIIKTDPLSGMHLEGLGAMLEKREQDKEDTSGIFLFPERKRVGPGKGRHGYNVESPWYDGRGHNFTIVDSPSLHVGVEGKCFSQLDYPEVLETTWEYGDPSRFMRVLEFELSIFCPVKLAPKWEEEWSDKTNLSDLGRYVCEELRYSKSLVSIYSMKNREKLDVPGGELELLEQKLWLFLDETPLWMGRFRFKIPIKTMKDAILMLSGFNHQVISEFFPGGISIDENSTPIRLIHLRVNPGDVFLTRVFGPTAHSLFLLASGQKSLFFKQPGRDELENVKRVLSSDNRNLFFLSHQGMVVLSSRLVPFAEEKDFHRSELFGLIVGLALGKQLCIERLSAEFIQHRLISNPVKAGKLVVRDREKLSRLEQEMEFSKVTDIRFGQKSYETLIDHFEIERKLEVATRKIDSLAKFVRESRENLYQKIAILVTVLLAPLVVTSGFIDSTKIQKSFESLYRKIFPLNWATSEWFHFLFVFSLISLIIASFWIFLTLKQRKKNILNWFKRLRKKKK